jgi:hypothetical protein
MLSFILYVSVIRSAWCILLIEGTAVQDFSDFFGPSWKEIMYIDLIDLTHIFRLAKGTVRQYYFRKGISQFCESFFQMLVFLLK